MKIKSGIPELKVLEKYADVMVHFAIGWGRGIKKGERVLLKTPVVALPLARVIHQKILSAKAIPFIQILDPDMIRDRYILGSKDCLKDQPIDLYKGMSKTYDHSIKILGDVDPMFLSECNPKKLMLSNAAAKPYMDMLTKKENRGQYTWTLCLYGTEGMARQSGCTLEQYWEQIVKASYLDEPEPVGKWKQILKSMKATQRKLSNMGIEKIHVEGEGIDLWMELGERRRWNSGAGPNIPSFEIFTSPDWRGTNGEVTFDLPLYRYGNIIEGIHLRFKDGKVSEASATKNEKLLKQMISQPGMDRIGEFSLTDRRFSKIDRFMAETLFDENFGGKYGNFHIALGDSYLDTYLGNPSLLTRAKKDSLGFNDSEDHTDIISSTPRVVTVILSNGRSKVLYKDGEFVI